MYARLLLLFAALTCLVVIASNIYVIRTVKTAYTMEQEEMQQVIIRRANARTTHEEARGDEEDLANWMGRFVDAVTLGEPKVTCWVSGEAEHEVTTPRNAGEGEDPWCARHDDAVALAQETYPDEGDCPE